MCQVGSFGLVVERRREAKEMDGLIYYEDFETCDLAFLASSMAFWDLLKARKCVGRSSFAVKIWGKTCHP